MKLFGGTARLLKPRPQAWSAVDAWRDSRDNRLEQVAQSHASALARADATLMSRMIRSRRRLSPLVGAHRSRQRA